MPRTQTSCPQCRQPVMADVEQLFDLNIDPLAKQRLLSGSVNLIRCPSCNYEGMLNVPIVFHDPEKELLLTHFPSELGTPVNEQERLIGQLIQRAVDKLPQEKRKGYLFNPQNMLTYQTLIEKILEADGITKEMLDEQQKMVTLVERLLNVSPEERLKLIEQEEENITQDFFGLLTRLIQVTLSQNDKEGAKRLSDLHKDLLEKTKAGRELEEKSKETEMIIKSLQDASKEGLTREKLLDIIINAESETSLVTIVSLARQGLDYAFFELLTKKINSSEGKDREKLETVRENLLNMTQEFDKAIQSERDKAQQLLERILNSQDIEGTMRQNIGEVNDFFIELVRARTDQAQNEKASDLLNKLKKIMKILQEYSAPPPEFALIDELLAAKNEDALEKLMDEKSDRITPEFMQLFNNLILQMDQQEQPEELKEKMKNTYRSVLRFTMKANLAK